MLPLILIFSLLSGSDVVTTCIGLHRGFQELNGVFGANPACARIVLLKSAGTAGVIGSAVVLKKRGHPRWAKAAILAGIGANAFAVGWNVHQFKR